MTDLTKMFNPDSVAIVGASNSEGKVGYIIVNNMINDGFEGNIYPINPKDDEIQGLKAYKNVSDLPEVPDLVIMLKNVVNSALKIWLLSLQDLRKLVEKV